ncbi:MAG: fibronectin type III domain-containing protein [Actinomycetota bacterium]
MTASATLRRPRAGLALFALVAVIASVIGASSLARAAAPTPATFTNFAAPSGGNDAGEPSIGVNWNTGNVMYLGGFEAFRVNSFNAATRTASWTDVSPPLQTVSADPILFTDSTTGRTFVSQLAADCSQIYFSDNDGGSGSVTDWMNNPVGCGLAATPDHQTVGGGAFAPGQSGVGYSHSVYYCAQGNASAECALSINGGLSFNPAVPIYTALDCVGLHGHLRAAPNGSVFVPNADCGGQNAVIRSTNNGTNWSISKVPGSVTEDESDPSVAAGSDGTLYFGWQQHTGTRGSLPYISVSTNNGTSWSAGVNVGAAAGIKNIQFPEVIAGDGNRAAFAFLGTTTDGDDQTTSFPGVWHLYVATTYDRGATWNLVDATPSDPVQRGMICMAGTLGCPTNANGTDTRNLLDFMDITVGKDGKVYVGYADGCVSTCITSTALGTNSNSGTAKATIAAQSGGFGLFSAYDPSGPSVPGAPVLSGTAGNASASLSWSAPSSDGGSAITGYKVYRGTASGGETLLATLGNVTSYTDNAVTNGTTYYYQVSAVNSVGEGARSNEVSLRPSAPSAPSAPLNLTASTPHGKKATGVKLSWSAPASSGSSAITGYRIYRGTSSGGEVLYQSVGVVGSYSDTSASGGTRYYYRVSAVNSAGESPQSNEANAVAN